MELFDSFRRLRAFIGRGAGPVLALMVSAGLLACGGEAGGRRFLSIGTAGTGGIYYPIGGALASLMSLADSSRQYTAEVTGGSVENVNRLRSGEMDLAFALPVTIFEAYHGGDAFPEPVSNLRILAPLYANLTHVLIAEGAGITSISEMGGKRVSVGPPGSGTEQIARQVLEAYGLSYDDVEERFLSFGETASALKDRAIDAAIISVGYPAAAVLDAMTTGDATLIGIEPEIAEALGNAYPYYGPGILPVDAYPGLDVPLATLAQTNWIIGMASLEDDVVLRLLDVLLNKRDALAQVHRQAGQIDMGALSRAPIPLHAAVEEWLLSH